MLGKQVGEIIMSTRESEMLVAGIPKIDPLKVNIEKFRKYYGRFIVLVILFLFYVYVLVFFWNDRRKQVVVLTKG
jgi:hypothetical protein